MLMDVDQRAMDQGALVALAARLWGLAFSALAFPTYDRAAFLLPNA